MNRRESLRNMSLLTGITLSGSLSSGLITSCATGHDPGYQPQFFDKRQDETVAVLVDMIIPATDTPGARATGVSQYIDAMLAGFATEEEQEMFTAGLADVEERSDTLAGSSFVNAETAQREAILKQMEIDARQTASNFYKQLKMLTLYGYYTSEVGASQELIYQGSTGEWKADIPYEEVGKSYS